MRPTFFACLLLLAACSGGDDDPAGPDAGPDIDSGGAVCTGEAYDSCTDTTDWTDCMDGMECRYYMSQDFTICSPTCNATTPCPDDENGNPVSCNMMGRCRSDAPSSCTAP